MTDLTTADTIRILRYEVPVNDQWMLIRVPRSGILHVASRTARSVEFWMREHHSGTEVRAFRVYGTGQPVPDFAQYEGTAVTAGGALVWHLMSAAAAPPVA